MKTIWPGQQAASAAEMNIVLLKTPSSINKTKGASCLGKSGHQAEETEQVIGACKSANLVLSTEVAECFNDESRPRHVRYHLACAISVMMST